MSLVGSFASLAAQGLWMEMLGLAARSREYGVVLIGEHPSLRIDLPDLLASSCGESAETIDRLIGDLITFKVASVDDQGRVFNRRMVASAARSAARSAAGRLGAAVANRGRQKSGKGVGKQGSKRGGNMDGKTQDGAQPSNASQSTKSDHDGQREAQQTDGKSTGKSGGSSFFILSSVSKDTGAKAPQCGGEDPPKAVFGAGLAWLVDATGKSETQCRSLLGKWRKAVGDKNLVPIIEAAKHEVVSEPVAWIEAAIKTRRGNNAASPRAAWAERLP